MAKKQDERAFYRNEIKQKNKEIVKICYYNGGNYKESFIAVQKAIIGEYSLNKFNDYYNSDSTKKRKSIINYLSLENLKEYCEKLQLIIDEANNNNLSISKAIESLYAKNQLEHIFHLELDENILNKANKTAKDFEKSIPKEKLEALIDEKELIKKLNEEKDEIAKLEKMLYEELKEEQKKKDEYNKFLEETDYLTDDYFDYINGVGDYEK